MLRAFFIASFLHVCCALLVIFSTHAHTSIHSYTQHNIHTYNTPQQEDIRPPPPPPPTDAPRPTFLTPPDPSKESKVKETAAATEANMVDRADFMVLLLGAAVRRTLQQKEDAHQANNTVCVYYISTAPSK